MTSRFQQKCQDELFLPHMEKLQFTMTTHSDAYVRMHTSHGGNDSPSQFNILACHMSDTYVSVVKRQTQGFKLTREADQKHLPSELSCKTKIFKRSSHSDFFCLFFFS